jgi:hypothetical protein
VNSRIKISDSSEKVPQVDSFEQLSAMVGEWDAADDAGRIGTPP